MLYLAYVFLRIRELVKIRTKLSIPLFCALFVITISTYAANENTATYKNQRGSVMILNFHPDNKANAGTLDGTMTLNTGNLNKDSSIAYPLSGYYNGNVIGITVNFPQSKQVTAIIGHFISNKTKIETLSLDALQTKSSSPADWNSTTIRAGLYTKL